MVHLNSVLYIPTKDRTDSLFGVLDFISKFYSRAVRICIADGSEPDAQDLIASYVKKSDLDIEHLQFDNAIPFFDRVIEGLESVSSPFVVMGADDDFPLLGPLARCEAELESSSAAVSAMGSTLELDFANGQVRCRLNVTRNLLEKEPLDRALSYARWPFATTYGVTRRSHIISRYTWLREVAVAGYFDYCAGISDALEGGVIAAPFATYVITRNGFHSYWRPGPGPRWRSLADVLMLRDATRGYARRVMGGESDQLDAFADELWLAQFRRVLGDRAQLRPNFEDSDLLSESVVRSQIDQFEGLISVGTAPDGMLGPELDTIMGAVNSVIDQGDEKQLLRSDYETI